MYQLITCFTLTTLLSIAAGQTNQLEPLIQLQHKSWVHGAKDCAADQSPAIEVYQYNADSYILRQNKCTHYEAPFIYVLFGDETVFVQDTGATADATEFPLYDTIKQLIKQRSASKPGKTLNILVTHSHSHGDHKAGDVQFKDQPNVTLVAATATAVQQHFGFKQWPDGEAKVDLGGRELLVFPIPGHQSESIAVYDPQTQWLLTGDSFYPGRLYIKNWASYQKSIKKLVNITQQHPVSALMGTHIEMSQKAGKDYPMGSTFQPQEAPLPLFVDDLHLLNQSLIQAGQKPRRITTDKFIIYPLSD